MPASTDSYRILRFDEFSVAPNRAEAVAAKVRAGANAGEPQLLGVFLPLIGLSVNTVTVATNWKNEQTIAPELAAAERTAVVESKTRLFDVLARGQAACDPTKGGVYTHRWFVVRPENVDHLTQSSVDAWKYSEQDTAMRVVGFWRERERGSDGATTILMIVYYPDLAAWEASRFWKPKPPEAEQPNRAVWGEMFRKRREIVLNSWVTVHRTV